MFTGLLVPESGFVELVAAFGGEKGLGERGSLYQTGMLAPGQHEFIMEGYVEGLASARYNVDLKLSPVPEPRSLRLLVGGALGLAVGVRQRRLSSVAARHRVRDATAVVVRTLWRPSRLSSQIASRSQVPRPS